MEPFENRREAGVLLARSLAAYADRDDVLVLGLPRGGVPVAAEVARALRAPLDVLLVRKLGVPGHEELAMGALASGGTRVLNDAIVRELSIEPAAIERATAVQRAELERRERAYRGHRPPLELADKTVIVVDDGIATGATMRAGVAAMRAGTLGPRGPARVVVAVPVAPPETVALLRREADEVVALGTPAAFLAVGRWYRHFPQISDDEVRALLAATPAGGSGTVDRPATGAPNGDRSERERTVRLLEVALEVDGVRLPGTLALPDGLRGVVAFAHGSGSSRLSPRNRAVATALQRRGLATLLFDLLLQDEDVGGPRVRFDIALLSRRLQAAVGWLQDRPELGAARVGLFGASTGAAAALAVAAALPAAVAAVVSRGGRPDLAMPHLADVRAPTLLIVGGRDLEVLDLNRAALARLSGPKELQVVAGAGHLFEEPGALVTVASLAGDWFRRHLASAPPVGA